MKNGSIWSEGRVSSGTFRHFLWAEPYLTEGGASPQPFTQASHRGLPLLGYDLGSPQNVSDFSQLLQSAGQISSHLLELEVQQLDLLVTAELLCLAALELLLQIHHWETQRRKGQEEK